MSPAKFPVTSRYYNVDTAELRTADGKTVVFLRRRFVPAAARFDLLHEHTVTSGERPDHISAAYLGDPEQYWQLCDANNVMQPEELTASPGRPVRITLPEGVRGAPHE